MIPAKSYLRGKRTNFWLSMCLSILSFVIGLASFDPASTYAANLSQFQEGNIISDSKFFDGNAMSAVEIQSFLNARVPNCTINNGVPSHAAGAPYGSSSIASVCLKDFRQNTQNMVGEPGNCDAYSGAGNESAATIIYKVGKACGISQKVLLVLLQKEQFLVTDTWPTLRQYAIATGFNCYDNGQPCITGTEGFFSQLWSAARQFKRYGSGDFTYFPVGQSSAISYQANAPGCGTKNVLIQNRATAALYYYTPYTPNASSLAAGYGEGDACASYGNRNFYQLFVDWFGSSTGYQVYEHSQSEFLSHPVLGDATSPEVCSARPPSMFCLQGFDRGIIVWTPEAGARAVILSIMASWLEKSGLDGILGYPVSSETPDGSGNYVQKFTGGTIIFKAGVGAINVIQSLNREWNVQGGETGMLGLPLANETCKGGGEFGCIQRFTGGTIAWSQARGAATVKMSLNEEWLSKDGRDGILGYPVANEVCGWNANSGCVQAFSGGSIAWSPRTGAASVYLSLNRTWNLNGGPAGRLGYPAGNEQCTWQPNSNAGCTQRFEGGVVTYSQNAGSFAVTSPVLNEWTSKNSQFGILGFPTGDPVNTVVGTTNYSVQSFQRGAIVGNISNGNGYSVVMSFYTYWKQAGGLASSLGAPVSNESCGITNGLFSCTQLFSGGTLTFRAGIGITSGN